MLHVSVMLHVLKSLRNIRRFIENLLQSHLYNTNKYFVHLISGHTTQF